MSRTSCSFAIHAGESRSVRRTSSIHAGSSIEIIESKLSRLPRLLLALIDRNKHLFKSEEDWQKLARTLSDAAFEVILLYNKRKNEEEEKEQQGDEPTV